MVLKDTYYIILVRELKDVVNVVGEGEGLVRPVDIIMVKGVYEYFKRLMNTTDKLSN
jgi:hypothetical protein